MSSSSFLRRPFFPDSENSSFLNQNKHIRPSYKPHSPVRRRILPTFKTTIEFPGSPDFYDAPVPLETAPQLRAPRNDYRPPTAQLPVLLAPATATATATAASLVFPGSPDPILAPVARAQPVTNFQVYREVEPQRFVQAAVVQPPAPPAVRVRAPAVPAPAPAQLARQPSIVDELRARATSRKFQDPAISEEARVFDEMRRQYEDSEFPTTPQLQSREEISAQVPRSAPIHRRSLTHDASPPGHHEISDFPALDLDVDLDVHFGEQSPSSSPLPASAPALRAAPKPPKASQPPKASKPPKETRRKHRDLASDAPRSSASRSSPKKNRGRRSSGETVSSRGGGRSRGRRESRRSENSTASQSELAVAVPRTETRPQTKKGGRKEKLATFREAILRQDDPLADSGNILAVRTESKKPRKLQPKNRKEISVSVEEIPGVLPGTVTGKRNRVPRCRWYEGQHYLYAKDGTLIGLAGMVDESNPSLLPKKTRTAAANADTERPAKQAKQAKQTKQDGKSKKAVVQLGERRSFEFREDERGCVWTGRGEQTTQVFMPAGASDVIENLGEETVLRKGVASEFLTAIEFELKPGGIKEPEKIKSPGCLRGVVVACGDGSCVQVTVGEESKLLGVNGSFMVESESEWTVYNKHKTDKCAVLVVLVADFLSTV